MEYRTRCPALLACHAGCSAGNAVGWETEAVAQAGEGGEDSFVGGFVDDVAVKAWGSGCVTTG